MENKRPVFDGSPPLPEDIIFFQIFTRLAVKSLYRFRCASKFCRSLTSHPPFLAALRRHAPCRYVLSFTCASGNQFIFYLSPSEGLEESDDGILDTFGNHANIGPVDYFEKSIRIKFINGFTFLARELKVVVRNFGTDEEYHLPLPRGAHSRLREKLFVYFCHDPAADKYKVLTTATVIRSSRDNNVVDMTYKVFTLGADKSWRNFHRTGLHQLTGCSKSANACVNGVLFCTNFSTSFKSEDQVIGAFDVGSESFDAVAYPDGLSPSRYDYCDLASVKGSVAVVDVRDDVGSWMIWLWIKVEGFGWMESRIGFPSSALMGNVFISSCQFSFAASRDGEIVIGIAKRLTPRCWVFVHNMETGKWRRIGTFLIHGHVIYDDFLIDEYVETPSLLSEI